MGRIDPTMGLVLVNVSVNPDTFDVSGSTWTEAGPGPGRALPDDPTSRWRVQISGSQDRDLTIKTLQGAYAQAPGAGARVAYRRASETSGTDYRGWNEPNCIAHWSSPLGAWGSSADYDDPVAAVVESTGRIVVTARVNGSTDGTTWSYDPVTGEWTTIYDWSTGAGGPGLRRPLGLAYDPDGDALLLYSGHGSSGSPNTVAFRSTDGGETWELYSVGCWDDAMSDVSEPIRIATPPGGQDWLATHADQQFASSDHGVSWELVEGGTKGTVDQIRKTPLWTGTGFAVVSMGDGFGGTIAAPSYRFLASARSPYSDAEQHGIDTALIDDLVAAVDYDGRLVLYTMGDAATSLDDQSRCFASNNGTDWFGYTFGALHGVPGVGPAWSACVAAGGQLHLVGRSASGESDQRGSITLLSLGGWDQVEAGAGETETYQNGRQRTGFGDYYGGASGVEAAPTYVPFDFPDSMGWSALGTTGIVTLDGAAGLEMSVSAGNAQTYRHTAGLSSDYGAGLAVLDPETLGIALLSGVHVILTMASGSHKYVATIVLGSDAVKVVDDSTLRATWALADGWDPDATLWLKWHIRKGGVTVWAKQDPGSAWIRIADDATLTDVGTGTHDSIVFGINNGTPSTTEAVVWRLVAQCWGMDWRHGRFGAEDATLTPADQVLGLLWGRPVPPPARAYPIPEACSTAPAYLSATGGPTHTAETATIPVAYRYGLDNAYPTEAPRPSVAWRTTDTAAVDLRWDLGEPSWPGGGIALAVLNATPRLWVLKQDDGAGGWTTIGTLDLALGTGLGWARVGLVVVPNTGTLSIDRYIHEGELAGTTVDLDGVACEVEGNSGGYWSDDPTKQRIRLKLTDPGAAASSGTAGVVCARSGVLVTYQAQAAVPRQKLRVTVAGSQPAANGYYEAGIVAIGRVLGLGAPPGWDWSSITTYAREVRRAADGTPTVRQTGKARRTYSAGWTDGIDLFELSSLARDPDRVAIDTSSASIGTAQDVASVLPRVLEQALESGQVPTLLLRRLPLVDGTTLTDPDAFLWGVLMSDSLGVTGVVGDEGEGIVRLDAPAFEEIR